jgi:hypothetical protein
MKMVEASNVDASVLSKKYKIQQCLPLEAYRLNITFEDGKNCTSFYRPSSIQ